MTVVGLRTLLAGLAALLLAAATFADDAPAPSAAPEPAKLVEALKSKESSERLEAARQAKGVQDDKLVAPLASLLGDEDAALRQAAIEALGARASSDARRKAASALGTHLPKVSKKPELETETIATAEALGRLAQPASIDTLVSDIELATPPGVLKARLMAVANVPVAEAIDALIQFLAKQGRGQSGPQRQACHAALKAATGEDLGNDPDLWRAWWKEAKKLFDFDAAARRRDSEKQKDEDKEKRRKDRKDGGGGKK